MRVKKQIRRMGEATIWNSEDAILNKSESPIGSSQSFTVIVPPLYFGFFFKSE